MERARLEVLLEARNQASRVLRQFGGDLERTVARVREQSRRLGTGLRSAGESASALGRGGAMLGGIFRGLAAMAIHPLIGSVALLTTGFGSLIGVFARVATVALQFASAIVTRVIAALRSLMSIALRVALILGVTLSGAFIVATNKAASFEQEMRNVNTIMRVSEGEFEAYRKQVLALSTEVPQTADILARGFYNIASAGFKGAEGILVLRASAYAATAGLAETDLAAKALTTILNAYGFQAEEAGRISDVLFKTVERGVVTFPELAQYIGMVATSAATAKIPIEEIAAAFMTMTRSGYNASVTATALNRIILSFLSPTDELASKLRAVGVESASAFLQAKGLGAAIEVLNRIAEGNPAILADIGLEMRALRAAMVLVRDEGRMFAADIQAAYQSAGATQAAYAEQSKALRVQWDLMKSSVAALVIEIGNGLLPILQPAIQAVGRIATRVKEWIEGNTELQRRVKAMGDIVADVFARLEATIIDWLDWLSENWHTIWEAATRRVVTSADWISTQIGRIVGAVEYLYESRTLIWEWAREVGKAAVSAGRWLINAVGGAIEWILPELERFARIMDYLAGGPARHTETKWTRLAEGIAETRRSIEQWKVGAPDWASAMERQFDRLSTRLSGGQGFWPGLFQAAEQRGAQYQMGFQQWRRGFALPPAPAAQAAGMQQLGPGVWEFPGQQAGGAYAIAAAVAEASRQGVREGVEQALPAVTQYTAAEQAEWYGSMARMAELGGRPRRAARLQAISLAYQSEAVQQRRGLFEEAQTQESLDKLVQATQAFETGVESLSALLGGLGARRRNAPRLAAYAPAGPGGVTFQVNIGEVNSKEQLRAVVLRMIDQAWGEQVAMESMDQGF